MNLKEWFNGLAPRERLMVAAAAVLVALTFVYLALWEPLNKGVANLNHHVRQEQSLASWLNNAAPEVRALRKTKHSKTPTDQSAPLLTVIDKTSKAAGLSGVVTRIQPQGDNSVRVWIENATFNDTLDWLHRLHDRFGINVHSIDLKPADKQGQVDGHMRLDRAQGSQ